jgi:hypothetical protein
VPVELDEPVPVELDEPVPVWVLVAVWLELAVPVAELLEVPVPVDELLAVPLALDVSLELAVWVEVSLGVPVHDGVIEPGLRHSRTLSTSSSLGSSESPTLTTANVSVCEPASGSVALMGSHGEDT